MTIEDRLRQAYRRPDSPDGFADRVLARLDAPTQPASADALAHHRPPRPQRAAPHWALAAGVVLAIGIASFAGRAAWHAHEQRVEADRLQARNAAIGRQLAFALDLTSRELDGAQRHVNRKIEETGT